MHEILTQQFNKRESLSSRDIYMIIQLKKILTSYPDHTVQLKFYHLRVPRTEVLGTRLRESLGVRVTNITSR